MVRFLPEAKPVELTPLETKLDELRRFRSNACCCCCLNDEEDELEVSLKLLFFVMDAPLGIRGRAVLAPLKRAEGQEMIRWFMMKRRVKIL
jgi:hypothetical protein